MSKKNRGTQVNVLIVYVATMLVCVIVFGFAAVTLLDVFVTQPAKRKQEEEALKNSTAEEEPAETDYSAMRKTILFVGASGDKINGIAIVRILPDKGRINIVPVSKLTLSEVSGTSGTISFLYESGGTAYLRSAVANAYGIEFDNYIKITDEGWKSLVEFAGGTTSYTFPEELYYKNEDTGELTSFSQGQATRTLWGDDIRRIITYPLYSEGEKTRVSVIGEISVALINSGFMTSASEMKNNLTNIFNTVFNNSDTDVTQRTFKYAKPGYEYMLENAKSPASYRLPKGEWGANGYFTLSKEGLDEVYEYLEIEK